MLKPIQYEAKAVGKHFGRSKIRHSWDFEFSGRKHSVLLFESKISKKQKVFVDGNVEGNQFEIDGKNAQIVKNGNFDLLVNKASFRKTLNLSSKPQCKSLERKGLPPSIANIQGPFCMFPL